MAATERGVRSRLHVRAGSACGAVALAFVAQAARDVGGCAAAMARGTSAAPAVLLLW